ncbi:MAG: S-adenosylmethionine:tRNA ribosyltransferase-isomerase, partial [Chloroflexi bacterium]|nr:S-adenosylmethionine:tRNA ribosyltransferase-isomerase [Chloroflexota bacterium]
MAAPTAGLHFSEALLERLSEAGVRRTTLTLHVGYGTFRPVTAERIEDPVVDPENFEFDEKAATIFEETSASGGRVVAVGTTSTRVLETQYADGEFRAGIGETDRYIYPPYDFKAVDALQTNFHLPRSSLLALVAAFAGTEFVLEAYRYAVREKFRFYSYGDVMLII